MTIEELNEAVETGEIDELIRVCEARQVKALSALADAICAKKDVRIILLCGGSSAGKTTTAKRLCTQLRVNGANALHLSTDDYFVGDARNPRHPDGTFDYEDGLREAVHDFFAKVPEETFESKEFSNARFVRNLYERTWGKAAYRRSMENGGSLRILKSDLAGAAADKEFKNLLEKNAERRAIGFGV